MSAWMPFQQSLRLGKLFSPSNPTKLLVQMGSTLMFQNHWDSMSPSLLEFYKNTLTTWKMDRNANATYLLLIPKCSNASFLRNFRPIGLCNTQYKIITKIIKSIISGTQASFISKRRASDNAIIV